MSFKKFIPGTEEFENRERKNYEQSAFNNLQPIIWKGQQFFAYKGTPLIACEDLKADITKVVELARNNAVEFELEGINKRK